MRAAGVLTAALLTAALFAGCASKSPPAVERVQRAAPDAADNLRAANDRIELAGLYLSRGQNDVALDAVKRALVARPEMPEAHAMLGLIYGQMGDIPQAEQSFQRALQLAPRGADTMHNYGWFLCQQRRYAEAEAQFANALAQPQYRDSVRTLLAQGVCQARAGRWPDAERTLSKSYELDPGNPVTAYNLSDVLLQRGELERARFYIGRVNAVQETSTAQSLWLATRIERRLGNAQGVQQLGRQLRDRFPQSSEAQLYDGGRFDE